MTIGGLHLSDETLVALLSALGFVLISLGILMRANAKRIEARAKVLVEEAKQETADADIARKKAEAEIKERADLLEMIKGLTKQNRAFLVSLKKMRTEKEADYQTLKGLNDSNTQMVITEVQQTREAITSKIISLDTTIQSNKTEWIQTVASEFALAFTNKLQEQIVLQNQYPFPSADDADWLDDFIKPIVGHVYVYNRPHASEGTRTQTEIMAEGENLGLYRGWKKDWIAVRFIRNGKAMFGWIQEHEVRVGVPAVKLATSEVPAVQPAPILNAT